MYSNHGSPEAIGRRLGAAGRAVRGVRTVLRKRARIAASRRKILRALDGSSDITFITGPGNIGDHLIHAGARRLLSGTPYTEAKVSVDKKHGVQRPEDLGGHTALLTGSGGWCRPFHRLWLEVFPAIEERFERVIVLPSSFDASFKPVREVISASEALFFAREGKSYQQLQKLCKADLAVDTAFFYDFRPYRGHRGEGVLRAYRTDAETGGGWIPPDNDDISLTCRSLDEFLWRLTRYEAVETDRAHVMIAAAMLGKRVEYRASNYHKVPAIAAYSLRGFPVRRIPNEALGKMEGPGQPHKQPASQRDRSGERLIAVPPSPFIVGTERSGTTLLRLMLDAHPEISIPPETHFIGRAAQACKLSREHSVNQHNAFLKAVTSNETWTYPRLDEDELRRRVAAIEPFDLGEALRTFYMLYAEKFGKPRWGDKTPAYLRRMKLIRRVLPEARFIHVIRDGRDVALSYKDVWFGPDSIEEAAEMWRSWIEEARHQARSLDGAYLEIFYEDLLTDTEATLKRICDFIELRWEPTMLAYHEGARERMSEIDTDVVDSAGELVISGEERKTIHALTSKPPQRERAGRWKNEMSAPDRKRFEEIAGEMLRELGYETGAER